ncbi:MAG: helix-turn-helix domain-containing protein [Sulfobacillus thermotolerans]|nr:helix-turn-helix domain-containing protein [Sulfobacillus thermotolerans]
MIIENKPYLTMREVAATLGLSEATIRKLVRTQQIPALRIGLAGKTIRIAAADLEAYIQAHKTPAQHVVSEVRRS